MARSVGCNTCVATHVLHEQNKTIISVVWVIFSCYLLKIVWEADDEGITFGYAEMKVKKLFNLS